MNKYVTDVVDLRVENIIRNLKSRNMNGYYVKDLDELHQLLDRIVYDQSVVSVGGSITLFESGVIDYLRRRQLTFLDRYEEGLTPLDIRQIYLNAFDADYYFASTNAITEAGELYNVDGRGNRVAAMIYGPKKVVLIVGTNKIVKDVDAAIERNRKTAAPANAMRLNRNTPCAKLGYCTDCKSIEKICHAYTLIGSQMDPDRMHIIFINESYGF